MHQPVEALLGMRTWAVVGWSPSRFRDSHRIAAMLEHRGHRVLHVNPNADGAFARLADIAEPIDVVDVFRRADEALNT